MLALLAGIKPTTAFPDGSEEGQEAVVRLASSLGPMSGVDMSPHARAMVAAAAHAFMFGKKISGVHDHESGRDLAIAAEAREDRLQGFDGDRSAKFHGTPFELYDAGDNAFVSIEIDGLKAQGYDRRSKSHYSLSVTDQVVQLYDHAAASWFAFSIQIA